jgi:hypothetical protein
MPPVGYPSRVPSLFRRKPDASGAVTAAEPAEPAESADPAPDAPARRPRAYTPSKKELGKVTPKRSGGRRAAEPPPTNRREAVKRMRLKQREARAEARAGMLAGKEEFLLPRDKGPVRALIRDIVDSRRNIATYFMPGAFVVIIGTSGAMPPSVRLAANLFWFALALLVIVDSVVLARRVRRLVRERQLPGVTRMRGHYAYAIMRSVTFRRLRMPAPRVKVNDEI